MSTDKTKITLHWLDRSRSQRILWLIYELDIPTKCEFKLNVFKRGTDMRAPASLKEIHPLGKSPVIEVQAPSQAKSVTIAESGAIVEYLCEHYGPHLIPQRYPEGKEGPGYETEAWLRYLQLMQYAEGSLMSTLMVGLIVGRKVIKDGKEAPFFIRPLTRIIGSKVESSFLNAEYKAHFTYLESLLATSPNKGEFFCGQLSGADILLIFPLEAAQARAGMTKDKYPNIAAFIERCQQRGAYKKAVQHIVDETGEYNMSIDG